MCLPEACQRCGMCMAECPRGGHRGAGPAGEPSPVHRRGTPRSRHHPVLLPALRGQGPGRRQIHGRSLVPDNLTVVNLPCAGGLSMTSVMDAFAKGAEGVMVLTCHPGNCNSETGAAHGQTAAFRAQGPALRLLGLEPRTGSGCIPWPPTWTGDVWI